VLVACNIPVGRFSKAAQACGFAELDARGIEVLSEGRCSVRLAIMRRFIFGN